MNEHEEKIIREIVLRFNALYGHDPTSWRKHRFSKGGMCLEASDGKSENVARGFVSGFDWMEFDADYTRNEMVLLATGFGDSDLRDIGQLLYEFVEMLYPIE